MSDYQIKIAVDSRRAQQGMKAFAGSLNDALKALRDFDRKSKGVFDQLNKLSKTNLTALSKQANTAAKALRDLSSVKVNRSTANNLAAMTQALKGLSGVRVHSTGLRNAADALNAISRARFDSRVATDLQRLRVSLDGFKGPSAAAVRNIAALSTALASANPSKINATASALQRLNGFSFRAPRGGLQNIAGSTRSIGTLQSQIGGLTTSLSHLRTALAGVSTAFLARGVYQTGNAFQTLQRTLGAVATTSGEVGDQMRFLTDLTQKMPVSLEAVAASYGRFSIAARLSGITANETQETFAGFATAFSAMGVGAEAQKRGFEALIQMFSKGKIQAEEIRQQLAEALPGAMTLLAESMGVTTAQLSKMLEEGKVLATELPGMARLLESRFGPAVELAMQRASTQLTAFANEWTSLKNLIFNSGFEAGLGALARSLTDALKTDVVRNFARDVGRGFEVAATHTAAFVQTVTSNAALFKTIIGGLAFVVSAVLTRSLLFVLGPAISVTASAFSLLGKAATRAQARILAIPAGITLAAVALDQFANGGRATAAILDKLASAAKQVGSGLSGVLNNLTGVSIDKLGEDFARSLKEAQDTANRIQNSPLFDPSAIQRNAELEAANNAKKLASLTDQEAELWGQVNAVGAANAEYQKQLALLDSIASKTGIDASAQKAALARSTMEDRNPTAALVQDYREELATMTAKTGEQKALNAAQQAYNDLLSRGQDIGAAGLAALQQYHTAIARMTGEIGNGFERWAASVGDFNEELQKAVADGIGQLSDALADFVTGADVDFRNLARSILRTFAKIAIDGLLKDLFGAMGMDPTKQAQSTAEAALAKLAGIGENITTAMTNVYTNGLTINGVPAADVLAADPNRITRAPLADITGTDVAGRLSSANERFPLEGTIPGLRGTLGAAGADLSNPLGLRGTLGAGQPVPVTIDSVNTASHAGGTLTPAQIAQYTQPFTPGPEMFNRKVRAAVRTNNPGAMWYAPWQKKYGSAGGQPLADGTGQNNNASMFPTMEAGAAAQFDLLNRKYSKMTLQGAVTKWSGGNSALPYAQKLARATGTSLDTPMSRILSDRDQAVTFAKTAAAHEAGLKSYPMTDQQWQAGYNLYQAKNGLAQTGGVDSMATGGIDQLNAKLNEIGSAAQTATPSLDQMKVKLNETGTSAQTAGQQTTTATQMKSMAEQQNAMATQMAGMNIQQAGSQAQMAGPQFQQAGMSIASAGQQASMAAASTGSGMGELGGAISGLMGPLSQAIPGLGQFGSQILNLVMQLAMGGIGGMGGGLFAEGGYATSPVSRAMLPAGVWANAPHYAEGTANTSGGMPAVLHPNEAVIPLTRGREVPVDLGDSEPRSERARRNPLVQNITINGAKDFDSFRRSQSQVKAQMASGIRRAEIRA